MLSTNFTVLPDYTGAAGYIEAVNGDSGGGFSGYVEKSESDEFTRLDSPNDNPIVVPVNDKIYQLQSNGTEQDVFPVEYNSGLPKFIQVWLTLLICTLLIASTLALINSTKKWCRQHSLKKCGRSDLTELNLEKTSVTPSTSTADEVNQNIGNGCGRSPRTHFTRRPSGPFGDDTIDYMNETYQFRTKPAPTDKIRYLTNFKTWGNN